MSTRLQQLLPDSVCPLATQTWLEALTPSQIDSLCEYASNNFRTFNQYLRDGRKWLPDVDEPLVNKMREQNIARPVKEIEDTPKLVSASKIVVRRGAYLVPSQVEAGSWQDPAFVSTSLNPDIALYFLRTHPLNKFQSDEGSRYLLEITIEPGTGFWPISCVVDHISSDMEIFQNEKEILLPPNLHYTVNGKTGGGMLRVSAHA